MLLVMESQLLQKENLIQRVSLCMKPPIESYQNESCIFGCRHFLKSFLITKVRLIGQQLDVSVEGSFL